MTAVPRRAPRKLWDGVRLPHPRADPLVVELLGDMLNTMKHSFLGRLLYQPLASGLYTVAEFAVRRYDDINDWWSSFYESYIGPRGRYHDLLTQLYAKLWNASEYPFYLMDLYPWTYSAMTMLAITLFIHYDSEVDVLSTPLLPLLDAQSRLGKLIQNGRRVRKALGGRTFTMYADDKVEVGDRPPKRSKFVEYYGDFVDEIEFEESYYNRDQAIEILIPRPPPEITENDIIDLKSAMLRKAHFDLLDKQELQLRDNERAFYQTIANLEANPRDLVTGELINPYRNVYPTQNQDNV